MILRVCYGIKCTDLLGIEYIINLKKKIYRPVIRSTAKMFNVYFKYALIITPALTV